MEQLKEYLRIEKAGGRLRESIELDVFVQGFGLTEQEVNECIDEVYGAVYIYRSKVVCPKCDSDDINERSGYNVCFKCGHMF